MSHTPAGGCENVSDKVPERVVDDAFLKEIGSRIVETVEALFSVANLRPGQILVIGCSTSEVVGRRIGTSGSMEVASTLLRPIMELARAHEVALAIQGCEHTNRSLVVERETAEKYNLDEVSIVPAVHAGGSLATTAYDYFHDPVMVESVRAHAGIDIGDTFIGMHLRPVVVPVRLPFDSIGAAHLTLARTRPKLVGGERAVYKKPEQRHPLF